MYQAGAWEGSRPVYKGGRAPSVAGWVGGTATAAATACGCGWYCYSHRYCMRVWVVLLQPPLLHAGVGGTATATATACGCGCARQVKYINCPPPAHTGHKLPPSCACRPQTALLRMQAPAHAGHQLPAPLQRTNAIKIVVGMNTADVECTHMTRPSGMSWCRIPAATLSCRLQPEADNWPN